MNLNDCYSLIERCVAELGIDANQTRGEKPGQWNLKYGSASVWVDVFDSPQNKSSYFQLMAPVIEVPKTGTEAFYKHLLEINFELYGVAFVLKNNYAYIKMIREVEGLDKTEVLAMLNRIGFYADKYDDELKNIYSSDRR
jgi:hypothetical protein